MQIQFKYLKMFALAWNQKSFLCIPTLSIFSQLLKSKWGGVVIFIVRCIQHETENVLLEISMFCVVIRVDCRQRRAFKINSAKRSRRWFVRFVCSFRLSSVISLSTVRCICLLGLMRALLCLSHGTRMKFSRNGLMDCSLS